jgi:hypothetical protein
VPGENSSTRKTLGVQSRLALTSEDMMELVRHGGRGLILGTRVTGRNRRRLLARDGTSLHEVKRAARRRLAESLLASSLPLKEIAEMLGYSSPQTPSRFIRQEFGATPISLREELKEAWGSIRRRGLSVPNSSVRRAAAAEGADSSLLGGST